MASSQRSLNIHKDLEHYRKQLTGDKTIVVIDTPATLTQAINNGIVSNGHADAHVIRSHVKTFLADRFGVAIGKVLLSGQKDIDYTKMIKALFDDATRE
jgi:hypothetical protein